MADGGLSTEALEDVIDWREQSHNAQAARAELAALQAAATEMSALRAALAAVRAELAAQLAEAARWQPGWREAVGDDQPRLAVTVGAMQRIGDALDAPRAVGAGETEHEGGRP